MTHRVAGNNYPPPRTSGCPVSETDMYSNQYCQLFTYS